VQEYKEDGEAYKPGLQYTLNKQVNYARKILNNYLKVISLFLQNFLVIEFFYWKLISFFAFFFKFNIAWIRVSC
jgi:hypothetical protein